MSSRIDRDQRRNKIKEKYDKILSWNINGLNSPNKRKVVIHFHLLKKQRCNVIFLQKMHVKKTDCKYLMNKDLGSDFYSLAKKKVKGIVFYINKGLQPRDLFVDNDGYGGNRV